MSDERASRDTHAGRAARLHGAARIALGALSLFLGFAKAIPANAQTVVVDSGNKNTGTLAYGLQFGTLVSNTPLPPYHLITGQGIASERAGGVNLYGLDFFTIAQARMSITAEGRVGVGTQQPTRAIEVDGAGDVEIGLKSSDSNKLWTIQSSGKNTADPSLLGTFQIIDRSAAPPGTVGYSRLKIDSSGTVSVSALAIVGGSDIAEPFDVTSESVTKGAVVVIDETRPGALKLSDRAYDTHVAGVVSGAGGINTGISLRQEPNASATNVALTGRVYALAEASHGPIKSGDLLTTSSIPGYCMKMRDPNRGRGAVLGKAMTPLEHGKGLVLVLVSLQ